MPISKVRLNHEITAPSVRLIGFDGNQIGIVSIAEARQQAQQAGYDLAEIAPSANPPVVKILDWGKYRYEQTKQLQESRKKQRRVEIKQVRLGLKIDEHDFQTKLNHARRFLNAGHKVKISLLFRGREITHPELGRAILNRAMEQLSDIGVQEQAPQLAGRDMNIIVGIRKDAKTQDS